MATVMAGATTLEVTIDGGIITDIITMITGGGTGYGSHRTIIRPGNTGIGIIRENISGDGGTKRLIQKATGIKSGFGHRVSKSIAV
jgi:hypothetical protein